MKTFNNLFDVNFNIMDRLLIFLIYFLPFVSLGQDTVEWVREPKFELENVNNFKNGISVVLTKEKKFNLVALNGNIAELKYRFNDVSDFSNGLSRVKIGHKYGFINESGFLVIPAIYDDAGFFSQELAFVKSN